MATPVPVSVTVDVGVEMAVLLTVILPVAAPAVFGANVTGIDRVCPGVRVFGSPVAPREKPVPVMVGPLTVTAAVPDAVSVTANDFVVASVTLPKANVVVLSVNCDVAATPVPESAIVDVVELLVIVIFPVTDPAVFGANVTGTDRVCPGARVFGSPVVPSENPVPVMVAPLTLTGTFPDEVSVTSNDLVVASVTLPKANVEALGVNCDVAATPVPESATLEVAFTAESLTIVSLPLTGPAVFGAKMTGRESVCPAERVFGRPVTASENPVPVIVADLTVTACAPEEVRVMERGLELPSTTLPKARLVALSVTCGEEAGKISQKLRLY